MGKAPNAALREAPPGPQDEWLNPGHPCRSAGRPLEDGTGRVELLHPQTGEPRRKFALIGFSSSTRGMAPLGHPDWAVVGMNQLQRHLRHPVPDEEGRALRDADGEVITTLRHGDLWFEIHKDWNTAVVPDTDHAGWLAACDMPVYMTDRHEGIPTALPFPVDRLIEKFDIDYFTSTVAYMFAWAVDHIDSLVQEQLRGMPRNGESALDVMELAFSLYDEYTVGVFGIDLVVGEEYTDQRPCAEFWLGQMLARNIRVLVPKESALLSQRYRYGYEMAPSDLLHEGHLSGRHGYLAGEHQKHRDKAIELYGRVSELDELPDLVRKADDPEGLNELLAERSRELRAKHQKQSELAVTLAGQVAETEYWQGFIEMRGRGAAME